MHQPEKGLKRGLNARHIRFMALGSAIGTGLFYGSASAIQMAGPAVLLAYLIGGAAVFMVMRALGEMAVHNPVSGSFGHYASTYLGPMAGFILGWTYAFEMIIVCLADVTAFGIYMGFWFPDVARWVWVLGIVFLIGGLNLCNVKVFGEMEFWLSLLKVGAIVAMILGGFGIMLFGIHSAGAQYFAVGMLLMFIIGFAMSAGPLIWVLCSEIQPLKGRDFGITVSTTTNWIANMIVGATFLTMLNTLGNANTFWVYALLNLFFILLTVMLIPETKNVSLEHIERNLMAGKKLRDIGSQN